MKNLKYFVMAIIAIVCTTAFVACSSDDDETSTVWFIAYDTDNTSANFKSNTYLKLALSNLVEAKNEELKTSIMTEKNAKSMFNTFCSDAQTKINSMGLTVLDNTSCVLYLSHAITTTDGNYPKVVTKTLTFTPSSSSN